MVRDATLEREVIAGVALDARNPESWPVVQADAIVCINMVHISSWAATTGLMACAGRILPPGGLLFLYGPFFEADHQTRPARQAGSDGIPRTSDHLVTETATYSNTNVARDGSGRLILWLGASR